MNLAGFDILFILGLLLVIISVGVFVWYIRVEFFPYGLKNFRKKGIPPHLKGIVDSEGRVILSSLASIWYENKKRSSLTSEDYREVYSEGVKKGIDKALEQVAREFFEPKIFSDSTDDAYNENKEKSKDPVDVLFENLPPKAIIETILPSVLKLDFPQIKNLSEEEKDTVYRSFLNRLIKEEKFKGTGEITPSIGERIYREEVEKYVEGSGRSRSEGKKGDASKEIGEVLLNKKERDSGSSYGNISFELTDFFIRELEIPEELVRSLRFSEPDFVLLETRIDSLIIPEVKTLIKFIVDLHLKNKLYLFFSKRYEISKVFKDYLLYVASCLSDRLFDDMDSDSPVLSYFRSRASYYYSLKMCRSNAYEAARKGKWGYFASKEVSFLPVVSAFLASIERPDIEKEFVDLIIGNLNIKVQDMFFRSFTFTDKKTGEIDTDDRYFDHLGFSYNGRIFLLPYAVDLWLDYYSLSMPYVLSSVVKTDIIFEKPVYVNPYTVTYRNGRSRTFKLSEVTEEGGLNKVLINALVNKEVNIRDYQNILSIEKVSLR